MTDVKSELDRLVCPTMRGMMNMTPYHSIFDMPTPCDSSPQDPPTQQRVAVGAKELFGSISDSKPQKYTSNGSDWKTQVEGVITRLAENKKGRSAFWALLGNERIPGICPSNLYEHAILLAQNKESEATENGEPAEHFRSFIKRCKEHLEYLAD